MTEGVSIVHDYLTQRGGAERVLLSIVKAFPGSPVHTSLYYPEGTFPEFSRIQIKPMAINRMGFLRARHRLALPFLAGAFSQLQLDEPTVLCSSSGWAHGARVAGRKIVYCYTPARWLYQGDTYLRASGPLVRSALRALRPYLVRWDQKAARSADVYLTSSTAMRDRIRDVYGIDPEVLPPPHTIKPDDPRVPIDGLNAGFFLCVSRLLPYKNVDAILAGFAEIPTEQLVVVGSGPSMGALRRSATPNVRVLGHVTDAQLRWLYANCRALVAASYEDYGLTPLEAAAFGKPSLVLRYGGFLDTVIEGKTGLFFDHPSPSAIGDAVTRLRTAGIDYDEVKEHARAFGEAAFTSRLRRIILG